MAELHLIMGCMFSGKSSELLKIINRFKLLGKKILAVNHVFDQRYGSDKIISHDKKETKCKQIELLEPLIETDEYKNAEIIAIEEGHFFSDLVSFVNTSLDNNKKIYVAGLNGDYQMKPIGQILDLVPMCETITKLSALCLECNDGTEANFSKRINANGKQIFVGSKEYIPVCRKHFFK